MMNWLECGNILEVRNQSVKVKNTLFSLGMVTYSYEGKDMSSLLVVMHVAFGDRCGVRGTSGTRRWRARGS
jgi:hypothetical protein